jgi:hypothetical protein
MHRPADASATRSDGRRRRAPDRRMRTMRWNRGRESSGGPGEVREVAEPAVGPVSELCSRLIWLEKARWPVSARARVAGAARPVPSWTVRGGPGLACLFMAWPRVFGDPGCGWGSRGVERLCGGGYEAGDPEAGANALIIDPGGWAVVHHCASSGPLRERVLYEPPTDAVSGNGTFAEAGTNPAISAGSTGRRNVP